ncbi:conjugative transfer protein MobI(A/C) [Celeribacter naphthalenivorans]|uniref:conjugative transfer protein MobI(A/C) n=1 Tax=Celeribacter naphthalenivorans TaxID=1614694 RepID=UPI001CFBE39E|nr:conjugative transfer protein MobI(A/C) [Celeribacter naphthalenivorans]
MHDEENKAPITSVDLAFEFEKCLLNWLPELEAVLIEDAQTLRDQAVELLTEYRKREGQSVNLGVIVRVRADMLGPRVEWVKFRGKSRNISGQKFTPTEPVRLRGKYRYSARIFADFPSDIRENLIEIERQMAVIRFRTERLAELRKFCRSKPKYDFED